MKYNRDVCLQQAVWLCRECAIMRRLLITWEMASRNRLTGGDCKPVYAADIGNVLVVNDTLKGSFNRQVRIQEMKRK